MSSQPLAEALDRLQHARAHARAQAAAVSALFQQLPSPLVVLSADRTVQQVNPGAVTQWGYPARALTGTPFTDLCTPKQAALSRQQFAAALQDASAAPQWTARLRHADGARRTYRLSARAVALDDVGAPQLLVHAQAGSKATRKASAVSLAGSPPDLPPTPTIPLERPVLGRDLETLPEHLGCTITRCCVLLGVAAMAYYDWRSRPDEPLPSRTVALHVRLLDAFPRLAKAAYDYVDLRQALADKLDRKVTLIEVSLLLGMERTSGYRWRRGVPPSEMVVGLINHLVELPAAAVEHYYTLVEAEAALAGIDDLWTRGKWRS